MLLHACCAGCAVFPIESLRSEGMEVTGTFWNPNIHPFREYEARKTALQTLAQHLEVRLIGQDAYGLKDFLRAVVFREQNRCRVCISMRLAETAKRAKAGSFTAFTTTMLSSTTMDHDLIQEVGMQMSEEVGIPFLYRDFRSGGKRSLEVTSALGLYRQVYCGCIYSEEDRFRKRGDHRPQESVV